MKLDSKEQNFDSWKTWERGAPDLAVEIVSDSDRSESEWTIKLARYQAAGIFEVVRFDPEEASPLRVWDRVNGELIERSPESSTHRECGALGLWWVVAPSDLGPLLRLAHDREGERLLPTPTEERIRLAEELAAERKARAHAEHARMVAEHERIVAEQKQMAAEQERVAAEQKQMAAEQKQFAAEQKQVAAEQKQFAAERERDAAAAEAERLRAEIARLRGGS